MPAFAVRLCGPDGHTRKSITSLGSAKAERIPRRRCVCPAHHREAHFGSKAGEIATALTALRARDAELSSLRRDQRSEF